MYVKNYQIFYLLTLLKIIYKDVNKAGLFMVKSSVYPKNVIVTERIPTKLNLTAA